MNEPNTKLKTGPKTLEGKNSISQNAFKHGLRSQSLVVQPLVFTETQDEYNSLHQGLVASIKPQSTFEDFCVHNIAKAIFRLRRADNLEASLFNTYKPYMEIFDQADTTRINIREPELLDLIIRYRTSLNNEVTRAMNTLQTFRFNFQHELFGNEGQKNEPTEK